MGKSNTLTFKEIKALEITHAYAEYKTRFSGDMGEEFVNWPDNLLKVIKSKKRKNGKSKFNH